MWNWFNNNNEKYYDRFNGYYGLYFVRKLNVYCIFILQQQRENDI